jgi:hypothetical protein
MKTVSKLNSAKVRRTKKLARKSLERYGKPSLSLHDLRDKLDEQLKEMSLGDYIVKERNSAP